MGMAVENSHIENISSSLIREYLNRKGLVQTLQAMDEEMPRTEASFSKRATLAKEAYLEKLMKKNKEQTQPLRTMIEVLVKYHIEKLSRKESVPQQVSYQEMSTSSSGKQPSQDGNLKTKDQHKKLHKTRSREKHEFDGRPQENTGQSYKKEDTMYVTMREDNETRRVASPMSPQVDVSHQKHDAVMKSSSLSKKSQRPSSAMRSRGLGGPVTSNVETKKFSKRSSRAASDSSTSFSTEFSSSVSNSPEKSAKSKLKDFGFNFDSAEEKGKLEQKSSLTEEPDLLNDVHQTKSKKKPDKEKEILGGNDMDYLDGPVERLSSRRSRQEENNDKPQRKKEDAPRLSSPKKQFGDLEMDDVDEDDLEQDLRDLQLGPAIKKSMKYVDARPLTLKKAVELKSLIFGSPSGCFNDEWMKQGFPFNERPHLEFGIVQHKGGSCGVLASVQACFLRNLLFDDDRILSPADLRPGKREQNKCLAKTLASILWQIGSEKRVVVVMPTGKSQFTTGGRYKADGLTETLMLYHFTSLPDLEDYLNDNIGIFINSTGNGVVLFLYSVIFSKSLEGIIGEMDEPTNHLMGHHNYCTQEMVNLILTGRAVSNVFNDVMELDSGGGPKMILNGINKRSDIGLLSLFEHYKSCKVGSYFKTPRYPVWIVCSESHFSVLFSLKKNLLSDWKAERNFNLFYYDGLANQEEQIRLSVNTIASCPPSEDGDLTPPLEHCIRTKWPDALIDWNGTEPIL